MSEATTEATTEISQEELAKQHNEQMLLIRKNILEANKKNHAAFEKSLLDMPFPNTAFHQALLFLDTAMLWVEKVIEIAPLVDKSQQVPQPPAPTAPTVQ